MNKAIIFSCAVIDIITFYASNKNIDEYEKTKRMHLLQFKRKMTDISSSNMRCESNFMRMNCGGEFLLCLLLASPLTMNAIRMTSFDCAISPKWLLMINVQFVIYTLAEK